MQYGGELIPYRRMSKKQKIKEGDNIEYFKLFLFLFGGILISRVTINNLIAPFGMGLVFYFLLYKEYKDSIPIGIGTIIGYISLWGRIDNFMWYILLNAVVYLISYFVKGISRINKIIMFSIASVIIFLMGDFIFLDYDIKKATISSILNIGAILPIYYIVENSIVSFEKIKTKHLFKNDEILGISFIISLLVAGTYGINILGVSLSNILCFFSVIVISYVKGASLGTAAGASLGIIIGITSGSLLEYVTIFTLSSLAVGIFKEGGKALSFISFVLTFTLLKIWTNYSSDYKLIEGIIACTTFIIIPERFYNSLRVEFDFNSKVDSLNGIYIEKIKDIFCSKLSNYSDVLYKMSNILNQLVGNENLSIKGKSSELIQNLADNVCGTCSMRSICWKRESYYTYESFKELIQNYQENNKVIPDVLQRKCLKRTELMNYTEGIVNSFIISEMWKNRLNEGREIIASQINNIASSVEEVAFEIDSYIKFDSLMEEKIKRVFRKENISYNEVFCFVDKDNRNKISINRKACNGNQFCVKNIIPILNSVMNKTMCVSKDGCIIDKENNCSINFVETPKYHIASFVASLCKDGEDCCGDSYFNGDVEDGSYISILSDGMGTGPEAGEESRASVELIEKLTKYGFSKATAINTVNSIMTLKFYENEKFSTVDLMSVDLYTGKADFIKVGAVPSFIKNGERVESIESRTLPMGVLDKAEIEINNKILKPGDMIVTLSDGVLDYNNESIGDYSWIIDFLTSKKTIDPEKLCNEIIEKSKKLRDNKINDDMTVIVSKVYEIY